MSSDVRKIIYGTLIAFVLMLVFWFGFLFLAACGGSIACAQAYPQPERTSIPTLIPAFMPVPQKATGALVIKCSANALDLIGAWIEAGKPETEPFEFMATDGQFCVAVYATDIQPLFSVGNIWFQGAPACITCHHADIATAMKNLDLSSYAGLLAGSERLSLTATGKEILSGASWEKSRLYDVLAISKIMPLGVPPSVNIENTIIFAGAVKPVEVP